MTERQEHLYGPPVNTVNTRATNQHQNADRIKNDHTGPVVHDRRYRLSMRQYNATAVNRFGSIDGQPVTSIGGET